MPQAAISAALGLELFGDGCLLARLLRLNSLLGRHSLEAFAVGLVGLALVAAFLLFGS